jgi:hypothetical protein
MSRNISTIIGWTRRHYANTVGETGVPILLNLKQAYAKTAQLSPIGDQKLATIDCVNPGGQL